LVGFELVLVKGAPLAQEVCFLLTQLHFHQLQQLVQVVLCEEVLATRVNSLLYQQLHVFKERVERVIVALVEALVQVVNGFAFTLRAFYCNLSIFAIAFRVASTFALRFLLRAVDCANQNIGGCARRLRLHKLVFPMGFHLFFRSLICQRLLGLAEIQTSFSCFDLLEVVGCINEPR